MQKMLNEVDGYQMDQLYLLYDPNHYFGLGPIPKPEHTLADTLG